MSEVKVNKISPRSGTEVTLGDSGDTFTLPSGGTLTVASGATINNQGTATNFGATGSASWNTTVKTGDFTAVAGEGYFVNTTSGEIDVALPAGTAGAVIAVKDYANTFDTNQCILVPNGSDKIGGLASSAFLQTEGIAVTLVFIDSTQGWLVTDSGLQNEAPGPQYVAASGGTETTSGDYKIHTFTGPGTFCVSSAGNAAGNNQVEYLVVAGGGGGSGGSSNTRAPGGGAGGFRFASPSISPLTYPAKPLAGSTITVSALAIPITVGAGGVGSPGGNPGSNSIFSSIISTGGGSTDCQPGGSGAGAPGPNGAINTGSGNQPPVSPSQGNDGANTYDSGGAAQYGGAGGGALANGSTGPGAPAGGVGGGLPTAFGSNGEPCGSYRYYAGGGAGGGEAIGGASNGGLGGGGNGGGCSPSTPSTAGTANTGGGGGGGGSPSHVAGSSGGSGIVVIRYKFQN